MKDRKRAVWWADLFYSHCKCLSAGFNTDPNFPRCPRLALGAALHSGMLLRVKKKGFICWSMPESCWVFSVVALSFCTLFPFGSFFCHLRHAWQCLHVCACLLLENDCVFLHICDGLSHSLLCLFLISLSSPVSSSLFVQSFAAMLFTVILH